MVFLKALHIRIEVPSTKDKSCAGQSAIAIDSFYQNSKGPHPEYQSIQSSHANSSFYVRVYDYYVQCLGFGWTLPQLKIIPYTSSASNTRPTSHHLGVDFGGLSPQLTMYLKSLQMYCDYNCTSYTTPSSGNTGKSAAVPRYILPVDSWPFCRHNAPRYCIARV